MRRNNHVVDSLLDLAQTGAETFLDDYFAMFPQLHGSPLFDAIRLLEAKELLNAPPFVAEAYRLVHHARLYEWEYKASA